MTFWRSNLSTWKETPDTPSVNTAAASASAEVRLAALEKKWLDYGKAQFAREQRERREAGGELVNHDRSLAQTAMMRSGGSINAAQGDFARRERLFRRATRPYSFDSGGNLLSATSAAGNAYKTGW